MARVHPATIYHNQRRRIFSIYEKRGLDITLDVIKDTNLLPHIKAGLKGEVIFYDRFKKKLNLEPLLDAGIKADFAGIRDGRMVNFDVTTNLSYKNIDNYLNLIQEREKMYEIALVNLNSEEIDIFPLRFPICPSCGRFSHYILYLEPPRSEYCKLWHISDTQSVIHFCSRCGFFEKTTCNSFEISLIYPRIEGNEVDVHEASMYPLVYERAFKEESEPRKREAIKIVQLFERTTDLLISGLSHSVRVIVVPRDLRAPRNEYLDGALLWKHPLAKELGDYLGLYVDDSKYEIMKSACVSHSSKP